MKELLKVVDRLSNLKVSVIVATYRRSDELKKALLSIVRQTYDNVEIILVDDNADEYWNGIVFQIYNEISNLKSIKLLVNESNRGSAISRNLGISKASGDYITFLDDDDLYLPEKIEKQLEDMLAKDADYGITNLALFNPNDQLIEIRNRDYISETSVEVLIKYHLMYHLTGTDCLMFRAKYLRDIGCFPPIDQGDEFYLMLNAILNKGIIAYSNHCFVKAYLHPAADNNLSNGQGKLNGENALFKKKKMYFSYLTNKEKRYVCGRHYAVISFTNLKMHKLLSAFFYGLLAIVISPVGMIQLLINRLNKR